MVSSGGIGDREDCWARKAFRVGMFAILLFEKERKVDSSLSIINLHKSKQQR